MSIEVLDRRQFDDYRLTYINVINVWINDAPFSSIFQGKEFWGMRVFNKTEILRGR